MLHLCKQCSEVHLSKVLLHLRAVIKGQVASEIKLCHVASQCSKVVLHQCSKVQRSCCISESSVQSTKDDVASLRSRVVFKSAMVMYISVVLQQCSKISNIASHWLRAEVMLHWSLRAKVQRSCCSKYECKSAICCPGMITRNGTFCAMSCWLSYYIYYNSFLPRAHAQGVK